MAEQAIIIAAEGLRCPLPALRLAKAVRDHGPGLYHLVADDPAAETDIPALCSERGWTLEHCADSYRVRVRG